MNDWSLDEADGQSLEFGFPVEGDGEEVETLDHRHKVLIAGQADGALDAPSGARPPAMIVQ